MIKTGITDLRYCDLNSSQSSNNFFTGLPSTRPLIKIIT